MIKNLTGEGKSIMHIWPGMKTPLLLFTSGFFLSHMNMQTHFGE